MNIPIILIVAIAFFGFLQGSHHQAHGNNTNFAFNINLQSPEAKQEVAPVLVPEESLLKKMQNIPWQQTITGQWQKHRFNCLLIALLTGYGYLWGQLYQARNLLDNAEAWCCWKNHIDCDHLVTYSREELSKELFIDIQERYINMDNPTDFLLPLSSFLPVIERERILLERYIWWGTKILTCKGYWIFPVNQECIDLARNAVRRLKFIKGLFIAWWAVHNSQQNVAIRL